MQAIAGRHRIDAHIAVGKFALHHRAVAIVADHIGERCGDSDTASCPSEFTCHLYSLADTMSGKSVCEFLISGFLHLHLCEAVCKIAHEGHKSYHIGQALGSDRNITVSCRLKAQSIGYSAALCKFIGSHRTYVFIASACRRRFRIDIDAGRHRLLSIGCCGTRRDYTHPLFCRSPLHSVRRRRCRANECAVDKEVDTGDCRAFNRGRRLQRDSLAHFDRRAGSRRRNRDNWCCRL